MEKKYLVGYVYGRESVIWDDVKDFEESFDEENGLKTIKFKENNVEYIYIGNETRGYREQNNKAPFITDYKLVGRRTALRHDYLDDTKRREARPLNHNDYDEDDFDEYEDDLDDEFDHEYDDRERYTPRYNSSCGNSYSCGASEPDWYEYTPRCGGSCGNYGNYYRNTGCGGGYYRCGGGGGC